MATLERILQEEQVQSEQRADLELLGPPRPASLNVTILGGAVSLALNGTPPPGLSVEGSEIRVKPGQYAVTLLLQNADFGPAGYVVYPALGAPDLGPGNEKAAVAYLPNTPRVVAFTILNTLTTGDAPMRARTDLDTFNALGDGTRLVFTDPTIIYEPPGG